MTLLTEAHRFTLENFEGPLDLLLHLILKSEIDIREVTLHQITQQFLSFVEGEDADELERHAEVLGTTASLLYLKSKRLLPREPGDEDEDEEDPRFEIIHKLMDYCRFRDLGNDLNERIQRESGHFYRGVHAPDLSGSRPPGAEHLSPTDLALILKDTLQRAASFQGADIEDEEWRVADKIKWLKHTLSQTPEVKLETLFPPSAGRLECLVTFLAMLELMKLHRIAVIRDENAQIRVVATEPKNDKDQ